jgi:hypothetical protein
MAVTRDTKNGIVKMTAAADEVTGQLPVQFIYWYAKGATAGDDLLVTDSADNEIYADAATEANYTRIFPVNRWVYGIKVATLDHGYIVVMLEKTYGILAY